MFNAKDYIRKSIKNIGIDLNPIDIDKPPNREMGDIVGKLIVYNDSDKINEVDLTVLKDVKKV